MGAKAKFILVLSMFFYVHLLSMLMKLLPQKFILAGQA